MNWSASRFRCSPMLKLGKFKLKFFFAGWLLSLATMSLFNLLSHKSLTAKVCNGDPANHHQHATASRSSDNEEHQGTITNREISRKFFNYISTSLHSAPYPGIFNYTYYMMTRLNIIPLKNVTPVLMNFKPVINDVRSFTYKLELPRCVPVLNNEISLFVAVISAPNNKMRRDAIRRTWFPDLEKHLNGINSSDARYSVVLSGMGFIIGLPDNTYDQNVILVEQTTFGDILQINFPDAYYNLSVKATALLNWIDRNCHKVTFVLKVDDDVYVNARNLGYMLKQLQPTSRNMYGRAASPVVQRNGKWKMSTEDYPWRAYPNYFLGPAVLLVGTTIQHLLAAAQTIPYHPIDDLFLTGLCTERANIRLVSIESFFELTEEIVPDACFLLNAFTWLMSTDEEMKLSHAEMEKFYSGAIKCISANSNLSINPVDAVRLISPDFLKL